MVAFSSLVVAACAVAVTVKVLNTDVTAARPVRVLDQSALERQVAEAVRGVREGPLGRVACPTSVVVEVGRKFDCEAWSGSNSKSVAVEIRSEDGELSISPAVR